MFDHLVELNRMKPIFYKYGLNDEDLKFIKEQIYEPDKNYTARGSEKLFLYEVSTKCVPNAQGDHPEATIRATNPYGFVIKRVTFVVCPIFSIPIALM